MKRRARSKLFAFAGVPALAGALGAAIACTETTSTTVAPITGVVVRAEAVTAGRGCGPQPGKAYKYAAVVFGLSPGAAPSSLGSYTVPLAAGVSDCFADASFVDLPASGGSTTYRIELYVFDEPAFTRAAGAIGSAGTNTQQLRGAEPTWTSTCTVTQETNVQSLAVCDPLAVGLGAFGDAKTTAVRLDTSAFDLEDGGSTRCTPADAGGTDAGDAGDAGGTDAGGSLADGYQAVRVTPRTGTAQGAAVTRPCPEPVVLEPLAPLLTYTLDVEALGPGGAVVGTTSCTARTQPGVTSPAACAPMR